MSEKDVKKTDLKEDVKDGDDSDLNDRLPGKINNPFDDDKDKDKNRSPSSRRGDSDNDDFEEDDRAYISPDEEDISRGGRNEKSGDTEKGTGRRVTGNDDRSGDQEHREEDKEEENLIERGQLDSEIKYTPYEFKPINTEADAKDFDLKTNPRFGFMEQMYKACC
jgi:hypothetical protein